jgi:hypothetical protein
MRFRPFKFKASSLLIWVAGVLMAGFLGSAMHDLWAYLRLEEHATAYVYHWRIVEISPSEYGIKASYSFKARGNTYKGKTFFSKPYHLNIESVQRQIKDYTPRSWTVWYQPSHPKISSLERNFPVKRCAYALMTLVIFFYFLYLERYKVEPSRTL